MTTLHETRLTLFAVRLSFPLKVGAAVAESCRIVENAFADAEIAVGDILRGAFWNSHCPGREAVRVGKMRSSEVVGATCRMCRHREMGAGVVSV